MDNMDIVDIQPEDTPLHQLHRALKSALPGRGRDQQVGLGATNIRKTFLLGFLRYSNFHDVLFQGDGPEEVTCSADPSSLQARLPTLTRKMRKMCVQLVKKTPLPELSEDLDQFTSKTLTLNGVYFIQEPLFAVIHSFCCVCVCV